MLKHKNRGGFIDCQRKEVIFLSRASRALADVFEKNEKKNKTSSVYKLSPHRFFVRNFSEFYVHLTETERNPSHVDVKYTVKTRD